MSNGLDLVRMRMVDADPAPLGAEPPAGVMTADVLLDLIDERSGVMPTSTDTVEHTTELEPLQRSWRPVWAFAGTFVVLLAAIGFVVTIAGDDGGEIADQRAPTTTLAPQTTVAVQPAPTVSAAPPTTTIAPTTTTVPKTIPADISWEMVMPAGVEGLQFYQAVSDGSTAIAIGDAVAGKTPTEWRRDVWRSEDGLTWEPFVGREDLRDGVPFVGPDGFQALSISNDTEGYGLVEVSAVTRGGPGWIAVGRWELDGRVWTSSDGVSWEQIDQTPFEGAWLGDIAAGGPGFIISGGFYSEDDSSRPAIWVSRNGLEWQLIEQGIGQFGSIHVDPRDGSLLAFGQSAVWRSTDGFDWTAVATRDTVVWLSQPPPWADAVWVGDTIVAAGGDAAFSLWYSYDDGATWTRHDPEDPMFSPDVNIDALIEHQGKLIAVGSCARCTTNLDPDEDTPRVNPNWGVIWVGTSN